MKLDKNLRRKLQLSYGNYALIPGTWLHGFTETAVLEFLNNKQECNPEIVKLKLWFERKCCLRCGRSGKRFSEHGGKVGRLKLGVKLHSL
jgi:hypothetical protein